MDARLRLNKIRNDKNRNKFPKRVTNGNNNINGERNAPQVVTDLRQLISNSNHNNSAKQTVSYVTKRKRNNKMVSKPQLVGKQSNGSNAALQRTRNNTRVAVSSSDERIPKVMVKLSAIKSNDRSVSNLVNNKLDSRKSNLIAKQLKSSINSSETPFDSNLITAQKSNASYITQSHSSRTPDLTAIVSNDNGDGNGNGNCEVMISNLNPTITQEDIVVLFGEIGHLVRASKINQYVAVVVYRNSTDAVNACQTYHNRLLDGMPMQCNILSGKQNPYVIARRHQMPFGIANTQALLAAQIRQINASSSQPRKMTAAEAFSDSRTSIRDDVNFTIKI